MKLDPSAFLAAPDLIQALEKRSSPLACAQYHVLFKQGDPPSGLFVLNAGEATLTMTSPTGKIITKVTASAGSLLGLPGLIGNEPYSLTAIAKPGAQLSFITRDNFAMLMQSEPSLALKILQVLAAEVRSARYALTNK